MKKKYCSSLKTMAAIAGLLAIQLLLVNSVAFSQNVSGTVVDAQSGETLPGVNVTVKGTTVGTATDGEGAYSLTVPSLNDTLAWANLPRRNSEKPSGRKNGMN